MDNLIIMLVVAIFVVVIVGGAVLRARRGRKVQTFAQERGWGYGKSDPGIVNTYPRQLPFTTDQGIEVGFGGGIGLTLSGDTAKRYANNVIYLTTGAHSGHSFTFRRETTDVDSDGDRSTSADHWHVVGLELAELAPTIVIRRRRRLGGSHGVAGQQVDFPHPEFSAAYGVTSTNPAAAMEFLPPDTVNFLLGQEGKYEGVVLADRHLYVYAKGKQKLENIDDMLALLAGILQRVPPHAWQVA